MTVFSIRVPADTARYALVPDLQRMATDTQNYLRIVEDQLLDVIRQGGPASFSTVTTTGTATFPNIRLFGDISANSNSYIANNASGFGLTQGTSTLLLTNNQWHSTVPINVPLGASGMQAVNWTDLTNMLTNINQSLTDLDTRVQDIEADYVAKGGQEWIDLNEWTEDIDSAIIRIDQDKADRQRRTDGTMHKSSVIIAEVADRASSTGWADSAGNSNTVQGRRLVTGSIQSVTLAANGSNTFWIYHGLGYIPVVLASASYDTGQASILATINAINTTNAQINVRNLNSSRGETFNIVWMAI